MNWRQYAAQRARQAVSMAQDMDGRAIGSTVEVFRRDGRLIVTPSNSYMAQALEGSRGVRHIGTYNATASPLQVFAAILEECPNGPNE